MTRSLDFFCAFCRAPRTISTKKHIGFFDIFLGLVAGGLLNFIFWRDVDGRMFVLQGIILIVWEVALALRWRFAIKCKVCGFDPALYVRSPATAAEVVKVRIEERKKDPKALFSPHRPVLPYRKSKSKAIELE